MTAPAAHLRTLREGQASRRLGVAKVLRETPDATDIELAKIFDVSRNTIAEDRKAIMGLVTNETKSEMQLFREDQLARTTEKWREIDLDPTMSGAEKHLAWSRWMKLEMDLRGTAAPSKSISANVNVDQQVIPIEQQLEYLNAFAGLYDDERLEELDRVKARKRTCRVVMDANVFQKALPESGL